MTDRPIIFSAPMVRALLDGRKTQTRRVAKIDWKPGSNPNFTGWRAERSVGGIWNIIGGMDIGATIRPTCAPGDRLWIKETWRPAISAADPWHVAVLYPHDGQVKHWSWSSDADFGDWTIPKAAAKGNVSPLFMPRWASRLTLIVTDVRVQRLQEISGEDCIAEGVECDTCAASLSVGRSACNQRGCFEIRGNFRTLWNSLHGPDAWGANPWVVAISFDVKRGNIDQIGGA